jgi:two-component system nitrate/nitrite response regulator NarL
MSKNIRLALIDDHRLCRSGLTELLTHRYGMTVVGATGDAEELIKLLREHQLDILVMDLRMEPVDGLSLLARLRQEGIDTPVVVLTMSDSDADLASALRGGVRGYLLKDMAPEDVADAIRRVAAGEMVVAPALTIKMINILQKGQQSPQGQASKNSLTSLTEREREILQLLARGESNKAIAQTLHISNDTVKQHVRHILTKLNLTSRVEAAVLFTVEQGRARERHATGG